MIRVKATGLSEGDRGPLDADELAWALTEMALLERPASDEVWKRRFSPDVKRYIGLVLDDLGIRQPPPIKCCSDQFLFYLNDSVASTAYDKWAQMSPDPVSSLPPERFHFQVVAM